MRRLEDWIEYMEGEGKPKAMGQLGMLLKHSIADQMVLDNLRRLRKMIKNSDTAEKIASRVSNAEFLNGMHSRIMDQINSKEPSERQRRKKEKSLLPDADPSSSLGSCKS